MVAAEPAVAVAPVYDVASPASPASPDSTESKCEKVNAFTQQALNRIREIRRWAKKAGIKGLDGAGDDTDEKRMATKLVAEGDPEAHDPDLVWSIKGVLKMGDKLERMLAENNFCSSSAVDNDDDDDDDDNDDDDISKDLNADPSKDWDSDDGDDDKDEAEVEVQPNMTALLELLEWESSMTQSVKAFETDVHPHGFKWWRYRYEYCILEPFVFSWSIFLYYMAQWVLGGPGLYQTFKFYKTGKPWTLYRYAWA